MENPNSKLWSENVDGMWWTLFLLNAHLWTSPLTSSRVKPVHVLYLCFLSRLPFISGCILQLESERTSTIWNGYWFQINHEKEMDFLCGHPQTGGLCRHRASQATELTIDVWRRIAERRSWQVAGNEAGLLILGNNFFNVLRMLINRNKASGSLMHGLISWLNWEIAVKFPFFNISSHTIKNHCGIWDQICF